MLPSIRLVFAAIFATVVLMMGGFWLISTFQIAKTSAGVPPRVAPSLDPALGDGSERKQIYALMSTRRVNEISPLAVDSPSTNTRVTTAVRFNHEETVVETPVNNVGAAGMTKLASRSRSDDPDQTSSLASRPGSTPTAAVALTEDLATVIDSREHMLMRQSLHRRAEDQPAGLSPRTLRTKRALHPMRPSRRPLRPQRPMH